jgi:hypothetical protein
MPFAAPTAQRLLFLDLSRNPFAACRCAETEAAVDGLIALCSRCNVVDSF